MQHCITLHWLTYQLPNRRFINEFNNNNNKGLLLYYHLYSQARNDIIPNSNWRLDVLYFTILIFESRKERKIIVLNMADFRNRGLTQLACFFLSCYFPRCFFLSHSNPPLILTHTQTQKGITFYWQIRTVMCYLIMFVNSKTSFLLSRFRSKLNPTC